MSDPPPPPATADDAPRASGYTAAQQRMYFIQAGLTAAGAWVYLYSGLSATLAAGLRAQWGDRWWLVNGLHILFSVFGFAAALFPITCYTDYVLDRHYGRSRQEFGAWLADFFKTVAIELAFALVFFELIYALLRWWPNYWWLPATGGYVFFATVLSAAAPGWILPLFHRIEPIPDTELRDAARALGARLGAPVTEVCRWRLGDKTTDVNAALAGWGRTRRILLSDTLLAAHPRDEILAVVAHEIGHQRRRDLPRMMLTGGLLSGIGFYLVHRALQRLVAAQPLLGLTGPDDIAGFPALLLGLFIFSLLVMPLLHAQSRAAEYAADAFAARALGGPAALIRALERLGQPPTDEPDPSPWIEFLLHSHPSLRRRIARLRGYQSAAAAATTASSHSVAAAATDGGNARTAST